MAETGHISLVRWEWAGTELIAGSSAGSTSITLNDEDALSVGDAFWIGDSGPYEVVSLTEDIAVVSPALTESVYEGEPVIPDVGGSRAQSWVAEVIMPDSYEPIEVQLTASDLIMLPEGVYDPPIVVTLSDDLSEILDLPGQLPILDAELIDPESVTPEVSESWGVINQGNMDIFAAQVEQDIAAAQAAAEAQAQAQLDAESAQIALDIDAAEAAAAAAAQANSDALDAAVIDFNNGLATKSKHTLSPNAPGVAANNAGDVWERHEAGDPTSIIGRWRGMGGTVWSPMNLDATYIPLIDIGSGTFGDLTGTRILAKTIGVEKLVVADFNNYWPDRFANLSTSVYGLGANVTIQNVTPPAGGKVYRIVGRDHVSYDHKVAARPGEEFLVTTTRKYVSGAASYASSVWMFKADGTNTTVASPWTATRTVISDVDLGNGWRRVAWKVVIPTAATDCAYVGLYLWLDQAGVSGTVVDVSDIEWMRRNAGTLLVDGAVQANHFTGTTFTGVEFIGNTVTSGLFRTTSQANRGIKIVSSDNGAYGSMIAYNASQQAVFTLNGQTGDMTIRGDLMGTKLIQGATVQGGVVQTLNARIQMTDTGLIAYDSNWSPTFTLDSATGNVTIRGDLGASAAITGATFQTSLTASTNGVILNATGLKGYKGGVPTFSIDSAGTVSMIGNVKSGTGNDYIELNAASNFIRFVDAGGTTGTIQSASYESKRWVTIKAGLNSIGVNSDNGVGIQGLLRANNSAEISGGMTVWGACTVNGTMDVNNMDVSGVISGMGRNMNKWDFGNRTGNTNASGEITVTGLSFLPDVISITSNSNAGQARVFTVTGKSSSQFTVTVMRTDTNPPVLLNNLAVDFYWWAVKA